MYDVKKTRDDNELKVHPEKRGNGGDEEQKRTPW